MNNRITTSVISTLIVLCALLLLLVSPAAQETAGINQHRQVQTHAMRYAIHDEKLRETMLQLNALVSYSEQPSLPLDHDSSAFLQQLIDTVGVVAESAQSLKQAERIEHLDEEQFAVYMSLADQLYGEAIDIDINARRMKIEEMDQAFLKLNQTCIACHSLFREL